MIMVPKVFKLNLAFQKLFSVKNLTIQLHTVNVSLVVLLKWKKNLPN